MLGRETMSGGEKPSEAFIRRELPAVLAPNASNESKDLVDQVQRALLEVSDPFEVHRIISDSQALLSAVYHRKGGGKKEELSKLDYLLALLMQEKAAELRDRSERV